MEKEHTYHPEVKIGDRVIVFDYWNSPSKGEGIVVSVSNHFVKIRENGYWWCPPKWFSKEHVEIVTDK